eukprot:TRINITY_DN2478_c0_g1_i5.p1 TRINITY_DN2478_c0_g1~~TRINITY_DN2478_c0_g1_i5.p1  ORF type:complete len:640 (-),score=156.89 TRINITY_DN2478_c0_g1_i5:507-2375(-)
MQYRETFRRGSETSSRQCMAQGRRAQACEARPLKVSPTYRSSNLQVRQPTRSFVARNAELQQNADRNPVVIFLRDIGLSQYAPALLQDGFDDMETLLEIKEEHLKAIGFLPGHILKVKRHLKALQIQEGLSHTVPDTKSTRAEVPAKPRSQTVPSRHVVDAVQKSWLVVKELGIETVAEILYRHLFRIAPETKALFPMSVRMRYSNWTSGETEDENDFENSAALRNLFAKVVGAVGSAVAGLQNTGKLVAELNALGMRHINYNMKEEYFEFGGQALVLTLQDGLGDMLTDDVQQAWISVYEFISATIVCGLRTARSQQEALVKSIQQQAAALLTPSSAAGAPTAAVLDKVADVAPVSLSDVPRPLPCMQVGLPMAPSGKTVTAVQKSWLVVKELGTATVGEIFYRHLFSIAPQTKSLFPMSVRSRYLDWANSPEEDEDDFINSSALRNLFSKVLDAVGTAVAGLQNISKLVPELNALGMRHINYSMKEEYFEFGGQALVLTLQDGLGSMLTEEVQQAWISVYEFISASIISGLKFAREREAIIKAVRKESMSLPPTPGSTASGTSFTKTISDSLPSLHGEASLRERGREDKEEQLKMLHAASKAEARVAALRENRLLLGPDV